MPLLSCRDVFIAIMLSLGVLSASTVYGEENSFFLTCKGSRYILTDSDLILLEESVVQSYQIRDGQLFIGTSSIGREFWIEPVAWKKNEILYTLDRNPFWGALKNNYYLNIDRVSGYVDERSDVHPKSDRLRSNVFKGWCVRTTERKF